MTKKPEKNGSGSVGRRQGIALFVDADVYKRQGYDSDKAIGCITASSTLAMLIPPGIAMILYGVSSGASVGKLFMSGLSVGVVVAIVFSLYVCVDAIKNKIPRQKPATFREVLDATKKAIWALGLPLIILLGIYAGVMTPTEAAAVAVAYVLIVELFIYRSITFKEVFEIGVTSGRMVAMIFILIGAGSLLSWILTAAQVPQSIVALTSGTSPYVVLLIINALFLVAGMFMDPNSIVIVLTPLVLPMAQVVGLDMLHLGMIVVPVSYTHLAASSLRPKARSWRSARPTKRRSWCGMWSRPSPCRCRDGGRSCTARCAMGTRPARSCPGTLRTRNCSRRWSALRRTRPGNMWKKPAARWSCAA